VVLRWTFWPEAFARG